ncbi:MAG: WG repeat-containing protein [Dysgonamonadaceae bacterium]|jgi:hypothetical protein|nr:WG repeat-containing protein [Dysgonamonadaceae bacterium]
MKKLVTAWKPAATIKTGIFKALALCVVCLLCISCSSNSGQGNFDLDLIPVKSGDSWGYINHKGKFVINAQFSDADFFRDGLAWVKSAEGKVGYIGKDGKFKIPAEYKDGTPFSEGLALVVTVGNAPVCIDKLGKTKFELPQAKSVCWFSEGLALFIDVEGKGGFVDKSGKVVINPQFENAFWFSEGLAGVLKDGKWGFIDKKGNFAINPQFHYASYFCEGTASFSNGEKYGYINKKGDYVINPQFEDASPFIEGLAAIYSGKKYGFIDKKGNIEINPQFERVGLFQSGLVAVKQNDSWGFIDKKAKMAINPQFDVASVFFNDMAFVKSGKQWGIINKSGKYVVNPQFDEIKLPKFKFGESFYVVSDFYDTSEFIGKFFERAKDKSFDGFDKNSTLQTIIDHPIYGDGANARYNSEYVVDYKKSQKLTTEISISQVSFLSGVDNQFYTGSYYNKEYNFAAKFYGIEYEFYLTGEARSKIAAVENALNIAIEKHYNVKMEYTTDESGDSDYDWYEGENDTFRFRVVTKSDRVIEFSIDLKNY